MAIDLSALLPAMLTAAREAGEKDWPLMREYAETEFLKLTESLAMIERLFSSGQLTAEQARLHLEIQRSAMRMVLLTVEGLGILAVERAINAALGVVRDTVNTALGFALL